MPSPTTHLRAPAIAWPTIAVALLAVAAQALALFGLAHGAVPLPVAMGLAFAAAFAAFTPMHDAVHRSVCRHRTINDWIGRLASVVLLAPFAAFRYVHLEHHKHTNEPAHDPDHYAGRGPAWMLPARWLTQDVHYYWIILTRWRSRPAAERTEIVVSVAVFGAIIGALVGAGYGTAVLLAWIVPTRLAIAALSFSFDYLPHVPHRIPAAQNRYAATRILLAPGLTAAFLFQNYHLIHHLYPGVPFYRYAAVWRAQSAALTAKGAQVWRWRAAGEVSPTGASA